MADINLIKKRIEELYNKNEDIHVTVNVKRKKIVNAPGRIIGVYDKFFTVKSKVNFYEEEFSITYIDLLIKNISIKELN